MSNTYFEISKEVEYPKFLEYPGYKNKYYLSLTAFVGNNDTGGVQLTVRTDSTLRDQSGTAYITLNDNEIDKLIFALLERKLGLITATGDEQSQLNKEK